ncbi:MAG: hypothetical protein REI11_05835, partial [Patulibacter sp.]|nr:hypothetical protein [Patulibacter sp.]
HKAVPALFVVDYARATKAHWDEHLSARQRKRLVTLVKASGGRPSHLSKRERREVLRLVRDLEPLGLAKRLVATTAGADTTKRRRAPRS